jgi:hypothetical protein
MEAKDSSSEVVKRLATMVLERLNPDAAIKDAMTGIVDGFMSLARLGIPATEVFAAYLEEMAKERK